MCAIHSDSKEENAGIIQVSVHAMNRYAERVLGEPEVKYEDEFMSREKMKQIEKLILDELKDKFPIIFSIGSGIINSKEHDCAFVVKNFKVRTVKSRESNFRELRGGRINCKNKKAKKYKYNGNRKTIHDDDDE